MRNNNLNPYHGLNFDQMSARASQTIQLSDSAFSVAAPTAGSDWIEARQTAREETERALLPARHGAQVVLKEFAAGIAVFDERIADFLEDHLRYKQLIQLVDRIQSVSKVAELESVNPELAEYIRIRKGDNRPGASEFNLISEFRQGIAQSLKAEIVIRGKELSTKVGSLAAQCTWGKDLNRLKDILSLSEQGSRGRVMLETLKRSIRGFRQHLHRCLAEEIDPTPADFARHLSAIDRAFTRLNTAIISGDIPLQPSLIKECRIPITFPERDRADDFRASIEGKVYLLFARHLDTLETSQPLLRTSSVPTEYEKLIAGLRERFPALEQAPTETVAESPATFIQDAARERDQIIKNLVSEYTLPEVESVMSGLVNGSALALIHGEDIEFLRELVRESFRRLDDEALTLSLEYALSEDVALSTARSRFAHGDLRSLATLLGEYQDQNALFGEKVRRHPHILMLPDEHLREYFEALRQAQQAARSISSIGEEYLGPLHESFSSAHSLKILTDSLREIQSDRPARKVFESKAIYVLSARDLLPTFQFLGVEYQLECATSVLIVGFLPDSQENFSQAHARDFEHIHKMIERALAVHVPKPELLNTIATLTELGLLVCVNKSEANPFAKKYKLSSNPPSDLNRISKRLLEYYGEDFHLLRKVALPCAESLAAIVESLGEKSEAV